jgi:hypothetical protein
VGSSPRLQPRRISFLHFDSSYPLAAYITFAGVGAFDASTTIDRVTDHMQLRKS